MTVKGRYLGKQSDALVAGSFRERDAGPSHHETTTTKVIE